MYRVDFREFDKESSTVTVWTYKTCHDRATADWLRDQLIKRVNESQFPEVGLWDVIVREVDETNISGRDDVSQKQEIDVST